MNCFGAAVAVAVGFGLETEAHGPIVLHSRNSPTSVVDVAEADADAVVTSISIALGMAIKLRTPYSLDTAITLLHCSSLAHTGLHLFDSALNHLLPDLSPASLNHFLWLSEGFKLVRGAIAVDTDTTVDAADEIRIPVKACDSP